MTALLKDRATKSRAGLRRSFPVAAAATIFAGGMVALDTGNSNLAEAGNTATTLITVGVAVARADNAAGGASDINVEVDAGIHHLANSAGGDEITAADIGSSCYVVDDQTVAKTSATSTRSVAGTIFDVDANGVWVKFS